MITIVLLSFYLVSGTFGRDVIKTCPPQEDLPLCTCEWKGGLHIHCEDLFNPWDLKSITSVLSKYNVYHLRLSNSYLMFWPKGMFSQLPITEIEMYNCEVLGLESDDGSEMFDGAVHSLRRLYFYNVTGMDAWRWSAFTVLKGLKVFAIRRGDLKAIGKDFASISPDSLTLIHLDYNMVNYIHQDAFSNHNLLEDWELGGNQIEKINRAMLPKPANHLKSILLLENKIAAIPDDFFTEMPKLKRVVMAWNRIKFLNPTLFQPLQNGQRFLVDVRYNDIYCCSSLQFLLTAEYREVLMGACAFPAILKGKEMRDLTQADLDHGLC